MKRMVVTRNEERAIVHIDGKLFRAFGDPDRKWMPNEYLLLPQDSEEGLFVGTVTYHADGSLSVEGTAYAESADVSGS